MGVLDKFFGNSGKKEEDKVVLFVSLMMATAAADGNQSVEEGDYISDYISRASTDITEQKWKRIISKAESLEDKAIKTAIKLDKDEKVELVKELIGVAASDGHFHGAEFGWIVIFSNTIGLDSDFILTLLEKYDIDQNEISKSIEDFKEHVMKVKDQELEDDGHNFTASPEKQNETDWAINKKAIHAEIDRINKSEDELSEENTDKEKVRKLFNSDKKTQAFIISMYNISMLAPPIDKLPDGSIELSSVNEGDDTEFMIETAKELQLHNFKDNFLKIMEIAGEKEIPLQLGNTPPFVSLLKGYEKTMKTLSLEECEVLLFNLIKLSLLDKKLTNAEVHKINYVNSLFKSPIEATLNKMYSEIGNIYQNKDDTDYIYFRSPMDIFNEAQKKSLLGEINDELMLYNALISQLNKKLFFGKLTENKFYTEGSELLPLGNIYFNRGQTYQRLDKKKEALKDYIKATEIYPETDSPLPFHHAGCMTFELGDHTKCIDFYNKALDINTEESIDSYYMRGLAYLSEKCKKKSIKQAKSDIEKYLKHNPSDPSALNLMEAVKIGKYIKIEENIVVDNEQNELADQLEIVKTFYDDGTLLEEYQINTKQEKDGYHRIYYPNGKLKVECSWTNGVQDNGDVISYHDDGSKARQVTLVNHLTNGNYFEWYKNGQLKTQGIYNDKIPTILKQWDENGTSKKVNTAPIPKLTPPPVKDSFEAKEDLIIQENTDLFLKRSDAKEVKVNWLQDVGPIYPNDDYMPHVLIHNPKTKKDGEYISLFCDNKQEAIAIIDHIIELNGGKDKFFKHEIEGWSHVFSGHLFYIRYRNELIGNHVIVELNRGEEQEFVSYGNDKSEILYGIHKDSKKINSIIKGLNSIVYNSGEMTSGGGQLYFVSSGSHIVSYWSDIKKAVEQFKSIVDSYPKNAISKDLFIETEINNFSYKNLLEIINNEGFLIEFKTNDFKINLSQGNSSFQMNIYLNEIIIEDK